MGQQLTFQQPRRARHIGALLALIALLVRVVLPAGTMLAAAPGGQLVVTMCTGHGPLSGAIDARAATMGDRDTAPKQKSPEPCPYAAAGASLLTLALQLAPVERPIAVALPLQPATGAVAIASPPPPSRAPPLPV